MSRKGGEIEFKKLQKLIKSGKKWVNRGKIS